MKLPVWTYFFGWIYVVVVAFQLSAARLSADPVKAPEQIDVAAFPAAVVEDVFVPVPSEIFSVLAKLGDPDWRGELRVDGYGTHSDRTQIAIIFGIAVADGFLAVEAEDQDAIQRTGREVLRLANAIGIQASVTPHARSIIDAARDENWEGVRRELDRTQVTVRATMQKMRDGDLARCVSIGGWLRGTHVVSRLISNSYSTDRAELLSQPDIVAHFGESIAKMQPDIRSHRKVVELARELEKIRALMEKSGEVVGADVVAEIQKISGALLESIETGSGS